MVRARFGEDVEVMAEPGRGLVAEAGVIVAEVVLVAKRTRTTCPAGSISTSASSPGSPRPSTRRSATSSRPATGRAETGPCILAGPSCDSADVLYEKRPVQLPLALAGRRQGAHPLHRRLHDELRGVGFNGFPPLDAVFLG